MSVNTDKYRRAVADFSAVVDAVAADKWSAASPCEGWTAAHVVGHVIGGTQMISTVQTGAESDFSDPLAAAGDDPAASFAAARELALSTLTDEYLAKPVQSPFGEVPLDQLIGMLLVNDVLIHTWDLAKAAGVDVTLDSQLCEEAYAAIVPLDAMVRGEGIFGPKIDPPADADAETKLLCFVGRQA
jgi:uncharacterized protein (TIGR03086 family)